MTSIQASESTNDAASSSGLDTNPGRRQPSKMKVTVSFGTTKVVVPCGDGEITVRELISLAVVRYKKAVGKGQGFWVSVSSLSTTHDDGGMLDPDDLICDVCDDREHLRAVFDEAGADGASSHSDASEDNTLASATDPKDDLKVSLNFSNAIANSSVMNELFLD